MTSIHLVQSGIAKLLALFPDLRFDPVERDEYNRQMQDVFEDIRDFIILHYKATRRDDSGFWNYCRTMDVPEKLAAKLELWRSKGRIFREGAELFGTASWVAVLLGQGIVPEEPEPAADALERVKLADASTGCALSYRRTAEQMPTHAEFIARACAAEPVLRVASAQTRSDVRLPVLPEQAARHRDSGGRPACGSRWSPAQAWKLMKVRCADAEDALVAGAAEAARVAVVEAVKQGFLSPRVHGPSGAAQLA